MMMAVPTLARVRRRSTGRFFDSVKKKLIPKGGVCNLAA